MTPDVTVQDRSAPDAASDTATRRTWRRDYRPPAYDIETVDLDVELAVPVTRITAILQVARGAAEAGEPLVLDGERLTLISIALDGNPLNEGRFEVGPHSLTVLDPPARFSLTIVTDVRPDDNPGLEGLNYADGYFFTHTEPQGFRRITYFPDRPDVLARYSCTLTADASAFPTLLSNGDLIDAMVLPDGRHRAHWRDPFPKASYLFALAAGPFAQLRDSFTTRSGRPVALTVHARPEDIPNCGAGLAALKQAMAWDEAAFGREYDLDVLNVAVFRGYPGGAMENKGLNLYTSEAFLASPAISPDPMLRMIRAVVAHEYFHNWSGNRVGCRDWFELSLKEGFTIFRQQRFLEATEGAALSRISDVERLRELQFPEEEGAMAHAVRPPSYIAVNNLYTPTVYEKGAELIRMMNTIVGDQAFDAAMRTYFDRFDGRAASIDDMIDTVAEVAGEDFDQFRRWYDVVGPVRVRIAGRYDAAARRYALTFEQSRSEESSPALHIPVRMGLLGVEGEPLALNLQGEPRDGRTERVLQLRADSETVVFEDVPEDPTPSLFRGFSAHVRPQIDLSAAGLSLLARADPDPVNRWDATQRLAERAILGGDRSDRTQWLAVFEQALAGAREDPGLAARLIQLPSERRLSQSQDEIQVERLHAGRNALAVEAVTLARRSLRRLRDELAVPASDVDGAAARRLRGQALWYLMQDPQPADTAACWAQWNASPLMEDATIALKRLVDRGGLDRERAAAAAYARWRDAPALLDRWFVVQAESEAADCAHMVAGLVRRPDFALDNLTRVKATFDAFTLNQSGLHEARGEGYATVFELARRLNAPNPRLAGRFLKRLDGWRRFDRGRQAKIRAGFEAALAWPDLAPEVFEIVRASLEGVAP